jgi:aspartate kinase
MAARLNQVGVPAQHFESWTLGLKTTSDFGNAQIVPECYSTIKEAMKKFDDSM